VVVVISKFFTKIFHCHKFQRLSNYRRGKNSAKCNAFAVTFADPQREGYKLHSLLGSVGKRAETNFNFPAPPSSHISGICENLADTWPAATYFLEVGRGSGVLCILYAINLAVNLWLSRESCILYAINFWLSREPCILCAINLAANFVAKSRAQYFICDKFSH